MEKACDPGLIVALQRVWWWELIDKGLSVGIRSDC
jgi:hypothetical protein